LHLPAVRLIELER